MIPTRFQPRFLHIFAERISRLHFTTPKVWPAVPSPPLVVWLLSMTTYISSQVVTYLCLHVFPLMYCSYRLPYMKPSFFVAAISSLRRVSYPLYLQSPPSAQLHLSVPVPNPQGLNMFYVFDIRVFCCLLPGSYVAVLCVVTCRRAQLQQHFVAMQLHESNAPLKRAPSDLLSRRALSRTPSDLVGYVKGTPLLRHRAGATVDEAV